MYRIGKDGMKWRLKRSSSGELRFLPIRKKSTGSVSKVETINASLTSRIVKEGHGKFVSAVEVAGGSIVSLKGRSVQVQSDSESCEEVMDVIESFGCQCEVE